jgi:hypothetical protein
LRSGGRGDRGGAPQALLGVTVPVLFGYDADGTADAPNTGFSSATARTISVKSCVCNKSSPPKSCAPPTPTLPPPPATFAFECGMSSWRDNSSSATRLRLCTRSCESLSGDPLCGCWSRRVSAAPGGLLPAATPSTAAAAGDSGGTCGLVVSAVLTDPDRKRAISSSRL